MKRFNPFEIYGNTDEIRDNNLANYSRDSKLGDDLPDSPYNPATLKPSINYKKTRVVLGIIGIGLIVIFFRTFWFQLVEGKEYREISEGNRIRIQTIKARRGVIYDRNETLLTRNVPNFTLSIIPADLPEEPGERKNIIGTVARIIKISAEEIEQKLEGVPTYSYEPIEIQEYIEYDQALLLRVETRLFPGINFSIKDSREYLEPDSTAHLIGYTGKITVEELELSENQDYLLTDTIGKTGLEYQYEKILRGEDGKKRIEVDSLGKEKKLIASKDPRSGQNITLAIDLGLQKVLDQSLKKMVSNTNSPGAAAVALDPRNGEVLALVSVPGFDSNEFIKGISLENFQNLINDPNRPLFMRAVSGQYPPGSTIKPIIASAALQEGIITPQTTVLSTGGLQVGPNFFPDWKAGGHGLTDVKKALAESVNTFFYTIGGGYEDFTGLGVDRINQYARLFGLGETLGIDFTAEANGFLPTKQWKEDAKGERWYLGDTYHLAIGQGDILVTPLQVADYTAAIANGGTLYQPHLVQSTQDPESNQALKKDPVVIRKDFIQSSYLKTVREGLRQAVTAGSASALQSLVVPAAGKTGTAQIGEEDKTHAWFTGFAPYDSPEIVITVIVEKGGEGHATALPVAREGFNWYFNQR
ncbi:MAG: penicillin-binding protein 2 [Candidatus Kerfeldbacteria bacterium CG08_land_8_20_14_0_20_40_16]|uniref:Penicillin-binding protein 2 n=1 Tax=Candidatus Kerfeldbacteria bacterium CG08_land_8_20_14_0_20_40_16 TaxID=2014244 RepID=A0A2H0YUC9_9BACT|nr:MAG: penicillin-binding protein 2 [Candidatus Kerfeldbacteria bacterium CG08_land_8_20_14_0_20_40_16]